MKTLSYTINFHSFWLQQDKEGQSIGTDNSPILENGFPIFGGKALKGLFKEQQHVLKNCGGLATSVECWNKLFGTAHKEGFIKFKTARLSERIQKEHQYLLFKNFTTTAIEEETKQAKQHSLRTTKAVIPLNLKSTITILKIPNGAELENIIKDLSLMAGLIKEVGKDRHKGLGNCVIKIEEQ